MDLCHAWSVVFNIKSNQREREMGAVAREYCSWMKRSFVKGVIILYCMYCVSVIGNDLNIYGPWPLNLARVAPQRAQNLWKCIVKSGWLTLIHTKSVWEREKAYSFPCKLSHIPVLLRALHVHFLKFSSFTAVVIRNVINECTYIYMHCFKIIFERK